MLESVNCERPPQLCCTELPTFPAGRKSPFACCVKAAFSQATTVLLLTFSSFWGHSQPKGHCYPPVETILQPKASMVKAAVCPLTCKKKKKKRKPLQSQGEQSSFLALQREREDPISRGDWMSCLFLCNMSLFLIQKNRGTLVKRLSFLFFLLPNGEVHTKAPTQSFCNKLGPLSQTERTDWDLQWRCGLCGLDRVLITHCQDKHADTEAANGVTP